MPVRVFSPKPLCAVVMNIMANTLLYSLRNVEKIRPGKEGFHLVVEALDVAQGDLLALVGPSGCGKSTALDLLAGILRPDGGDRFLFRPRAGEKTCNILQLWRERREDLLADMRLHHVGYVLQVGGLLPFLTARDNILLPCKALGNVASFLPRIREVVERLGIDRLLSQYPATLSVGERQRVAIARALAHAPSILLADEPTAALDPYHAGVVLHLMAELAREQNVTVIMVTHAQDMARKAGFRLVQVRPDEKRAPEGSPCSRICHHLEVA